MADALGHLLDVRGRPDLGFDADSNNFEASSQYEPSFASMGQVDISAVDVGGVSSAKDDTAAISDQFIRGARLTSLTMPWETPLMRQIFSEQVQGSKLSMPLD